MGLYWSQIQAVLLLASGRWQSIFYLNSVTRSRWLFQSYLVMAMVSSPFSHTMNRLQKERSCLAMISRLAVIQIVVAMKQTAASTMISAMQAILRLFQALLPIVQTAPINDVRITPIMRTLATTMNRQYLRLLYRISATKQRVVIICVITIIMPAMQGCENRATNAIMTIPRESREMRTLFLAYHRLEVISYSSTQQCGSSTQNLRQLLTTPTAVSISTTIVIPSTATTKVKVLKVVCVEVVVTCMRLAQSRMLKMRVMSRTGKIIFFLRSRMAVGLCGMRSTSSSSTQNRTNIHSTVTNWPPKVAVNQLFLTTPKLVPCSATVPPVNPYRQFTRLAS